MTRPTRRPPSRGARHDRLHRSEARARRACERGLGMTAIAAGTRMVPEVRVGPIEGLRNTATLAWRTLVQIKHNPFELLDFSVQPLMFLILFTYVFGGAIAGSTSDYLTFGLPGIIVQNMLFATMNTGVALNTD